MDERLARMRAAGHPVRLRILSLLTGADLSATDVARELDLTHANASYHLRVLEKAGLIVIAGEEKVRGGTVKRYRHPWEEAAGWSAPEPSDPEAVAEERQAYVRASVDELVRRYARSVHGKEVATDAELWVTPEVWDEVRERITEASHLLHGRAQAPRSPGTVHVNLTAFAFVMADEEERQ